MRVYANHLAPYSIRVNSVHPAGVNTPMIDNEFTRHWLDGMAQQTSAAGHGQRAAGAGAGTRGHRQRRGWLVSDAARYVTGITLPVDAGYINKR